MNRTISLDVLFRSQIRDLNDISYTGMSLWLLFFLVLISYGSSKLQIMSGIDFAIYIPFYIMVVSLSLR